MKQTKKLFSIVLAIALVFAMAIPAFAAGDGKITITNAVEDHVYTAYKMLDFAPIAGSTTQGRYTIVDGWEAFFTTGAGKDYFVIAENDGDKVVTLKKDDEGNEVAIDAALAKAAVAYAKDNKLNPAKDPITATGATVEFTGLDLGYYAVDTSVGMICSLTNTNSTITTVEKNATPSLEKKILENGAPVDTNTVAIGDTVTYQATITVGKGVEDYVMHDKMSAGLNFTKVASVKVNNVDVAAENYTVTSEGLTDGCTFEIAFDNDYTAGLAEKTEIVVTYEAVLTGNAVVIGANGNPNEAWLEFDEGNETTSTTTHDKVITYTTKLIVNKVDDKTPAQPLAGAGFTLYKKGANNEYVKYAEELTGVTTFEWKGLDEGDYKIVESTVPAGYNKAADIEFTISATLVNEVVDGTEQATWVDDAPVTVVNGAYTTDVVNATGSLLPETGGMGTTMFYMIGAMMVAAAVVLFVSKKRMAFEA